MDENIDYTHAFCRFDKYHFPELISLEKYSDMDHSCDDDFNREDEAGSKNTGEKHLNDRIIKESIVAVGGPMDSPWPMKCHDTHHTGRSPYSTADTSAEKWRYMTNSWIEDTPVIDNDGTIYVGSFDGYLHAVYPNGALKWKYKAGQFGEILGSSPAINEDGTIYIGSWDWGLHAVHSNGTRKWRFGAGDVIASSPVIAEDGTIYFGTMGGRVYAVNPDGTEKWHYSTGSWITSDPAIGNDSTIYIGSTDDYLYALYSNGTLRWRFKTGMYVKGPPSIGEDGTIYIGSWDGYLYALYPNGTMKWRCSLGGYGTETNPSIASDGTIYAGGNALYAVYPNGTLRWVFNLGSERHIDQSSPTISADGTIYIGTNIGETSGGEIIAINSDGTERWRKMIAKKWVESSPSIGEDGTVYIGASYDMGVGYLYAFGVGELEADAHGPYYGLTNQPVQFTGSHWGGYSPHSYHWTFGDEESSEEQNPTHTYTDAGNYTVTLTVTDNSSNTSSDTTYAWIQTTNSAPNKPNIDGPTGGKAGTSYDYTFTTTDPDGSIIYLYIEWGDNTNSGWIGPYDSGEQVTESHTWSSQGTYAIKAKAKDPYGTEGPWGELEVTMPKNKQISQQSSNSLFFQILQRILNIR